MLGRLWVYLKCKIKLLVVWVRAMQSTIEKIQKFDKKIIIIAIIIVVVLFMLLLLIVNKEDKRIEIAANQVSSLSEKIRKYYRNKPDYWGLDTNQIISNNIAPQISNDKKALKNAFGSDILIGSDKYGSVVMPGSRSFSIIFKNLNKKACISLATYRFEESKSLGLISMTIVNENSEKMFAWGGENELPIPEIKAKNICKTGGSIIWSYE